MRLDKRVTVCGLSRSEARKAIAEGQVSVNGGIVRDAAFQVTDEDAVSLSGGAVSVDLGVHIMMNKPSGVLTATEDGRRTTVIDLLPEPLRKKKLGPVGRLDADVTGLVLLTTDGELAHRLISPKRRKRKVYRAALDGTPTDADIAAFEQGMRLSDFVTRPAELRVLAPGDEALCEIALTEGKFHQVKRMCAAIGHPVIRMERLSIGPVALDEALALGEWRYLTDAERISLYESVDLKP